MGRDRKKDTAHAAGIARCLRKQDDFTMLLYY